MTAVLITEDNLTHINGNLRHHFGKQVTSAHLTEAITATLGGRTHAALLTDLPLPSARPKVVLSMIERSPRGWRQVLLLKDRPKVK